MAERLGLGKRTAFLQCLEQREHDEFRSSLVDNRPRYSFEMFRSIYVFSMWPNNRHLGHMIAANCPLPILNECQLAESLSEFAVASMSAKA